MTENQEYKVLARKYRPQRFTDLIGQNSLVAILSNAILNNRIAHAYVLTGVRGVGKTTTARLIAMSLNCQKRESKDCEPCGNCESCISIREDRNLDVIEIDAASKTGVDDIREIIDNVKYKPVSSSFKIFIIDEVHMLSKNAFNALLKTLEEPPEHVKFIFATTEVKKIPITILSRCQRFDLHRIENEELIKQLTKIAELEKVKVEQDGSVRDGLSLLDQAITNKSDLINSEMIVKMLGLADRGKIFELLNYIFKGDATNSLKVFNSLHNSGADVIMIFDELLNAVHFITQIKISPNIKNDIYIPELEREMGSDIASQLNMSSLGLIWQVLFKGYQELQEGFHLMQHGEMIILRLIYIYNGPSPEELLKKNKVKDNGKFNENAKDLKLESNEINLNKTNIANKNIKFTETNVKKLQIVSFRDFVELFFHHKEPIIHSQLYNSVKLISFEEGKVTINTDLIKDSKFNRNVARLVSTWTGRIWQIHESSSNIGKSLYEEDLINQQKEIEKIKHHPKMKEILKFFPEASIHSITNITESHDEKDNNLIKKIERKSDG